MALIKHGNNALSSVTAFPSAVPTGKPVLLSTATASTSSYIDFTSGIDSTYDIYRFEFITLHPSDNDPSNFTFQVETGTNTDYNQTITSTAFVAWHNESDTNTTLSYRTDYDLAQSTSFQRLTAGGGIGNDSDQCLNGELLLFQPSSSVYVKHFIATTAATGASDYINHSFIGGYINDTTPITRIRFKMASGTIDAGTIKMYGISA